MEQINKVISFTGLSRDMEFRECQRGAKSRLYVDVNENVLENLENRFNRPVSEYRRLLKPVFKAMGVKARWSQKAGCSCGCSPGFILDRPVKLAHNDVPQTFWITIVGVAKNNGFVRDLTRSGRVIPTERELNEAFGV